MIDLSGRRALVTGGSRGIGAATAVLLARAGADVVIGFRKRQDAADAVVRQILALGRRARAVSADLSDRRACDMLVEAAARILDGLDLFIGNAGVWPHEAMAV
ncbi:MAG: SDR family NAD(P)-dependent oxidoreductase, partial [Gemmatimonadaceae bacterium]